MNDHSRPSMPNQVPAELTLPRAWDELLREMQELHAKLEYLRLMLRLNQTAE